SVPSKLMSGRSDDQRKQQILEIRKPKSRPSSGVQPGNSQLANQHQPPAKPVMTSPRQPTSTPSNPKRPIKANQHNNNPEVVAESDTEKFQQTPVSSDNAAKLQLSRPPARPDKQKSQMPQVERPILRQNRPDTSPTSEPRNAPTPTRTSAPSKPSTPSESSSPTRSKPPARPVPALQGPPRKPNSGRGDQKANMAASLDPSLQEDTDDVAGAILDETPEMMELKLRRPTPARPVKKKEWEDEEEEGKESAKAGKGAGKTKRRSELFLDEDEDLDLDLKNINAPLTVSLSVARPPKPKSLQAPSGATGATSGGQRRKPPTTKANASETSSKSDSRDRRREQTAPERPEQIVLTGSLSIRELATALGVAETEIIRKLFFKGMAVSITQTLDIPTATMVAEELGVAVETAEEEAAATKVTEMVQAEDLEYLQRRPPVVTIMGHVDHGKTTLLDAIRSSKVAQGEAGGITQHIGAYHVDVDHEGQTQQVVFLDTPGHEAFTAMRARGARVTDIAVLVVAADDGVRPQTIEAISHAKAAEVPIVVAINKIDKPEAQPDRVKQELTEYGLVAEEWGGETIMVPVSAIQGENLDTLLEMILLVADVEELSANPDRPARGTVIEANLDKARGPVATLLVQNGTLRVGDTLVAGSVFGKVRAMIDDRGARVDAASPSFAVEVLGLSDVPAAGDEFEVFESEKEARSVASQRTDEQRLSRLQQVMASRRVTLNSLSAKAQEGELKELNLILKGDVQGSVEAILGSLRQLPQNEVQIRVLLASAGEVTETDVDLAAASGAVIIGFNTTLAHGARQAADQEGVDIREYNIIYQLLDDIQGAMEGLLEPEMVEEPLGQVEVRAVFPVGRGAVAGCYVLSGKAIRNCNIRVHRNGKVIYEGNLDSLKRMKDDVKEVATGYECGVGLDKFNDWSEGDIIETFRMVSKRRTLSAS
ncbi:MAG TPA: translation initiation factor IF-2, partial [Coleofasciculaceae cyanobacterium]